MSTLTPSQAARIASGVYGLRERTLAQQADRGVALGCEGMFQTSADSRLTGRSGGLIAVKQLSGFGYIARGTGAYAGDILIATRGTSTMYDWLSNLNIAVQKGPGGTPVHAGFHEVWKSFAAEIADFIRGQNIATVHCVGHSLGGALATLNADHFSSLGTAVKLYTFGSPRVGDLFFSRSLSQRVGADNIHRVYHRADPVPKIPLFPFFHVPWADEACQVNGGPGGLISIAAHSMANSYIPNVDGHSWADLARAGGVGEGEVTPASWLEQVGPSGNGILIGSAWALKMIGKALGWLLAKIGQLAVGALGLALTASMTVLDRLAWMLARGATLSLEVSSYVGNLIGAIFRFLGRGLMRGVALTLDFIRWVLGLLFDALAAVARRAFALLG